MEKADQRIEILGCPVDNLTQDETVVMIDRMIAERGAHQHVVVNAAKILQSRQDITVRRIIQGCDIINADGMAVVWASRILGKGLKERVTGIDLMFRLIAHAEDKGYRLFFLGATEDVNRKVVDICRKRHPRLNIAGSHNGYWKPEEEDGLVGNISRSRADILFVAMGSPKKELFIAKHLSALNVPFVMGVGGSFDVLAGLVERAPDWMQKAGLEWFWRMLQEPGRLWTRYLVGNTLFILLVLKELISPQPYRK